jgi:lysophospholipase L1-like esterase
MTTRGRRTGGRRGAAVALAVAVSAALAPAAAQAKTQYVLALGGSSSTGAALQPDGSVKPSGIGYNDVLLRSLQQSNPQTRLVSYGCRGASVRKMLSGPSACHYAQGTQVKAAERFLRLHRSSTRLVTLSVGIDDLLGCISGFDSSTGTISTNAVCLSNGQRGLRTALPKLAKRLRAAAGRKVRIVAMNLYDPGTVLWLAGEDHHGDAKSSATYVRSFNKTLTAPLRRQKVQIADVFSAFSTMDFTTMEDVDPFGPLPLAVARICQWTSMCGGADPHAGYLPNAAGYAAIASAFQHAKR